MNHFFAYLSRLNHIYRWSLMRNTFPENVAEHTAQVAFIAHGIATIGNVRYGRGYDIGRITQLALFHDAGEVLTGDLATPIKYQNEEIKAAYKQVEEGAAKRLLKMLPDDLKEAYEGLLTPREDQAAWKVAKAADRIAAYTKCLEELKAGNREFEKAAQSIEASIRKIELAEVGDFMREFVPSFALSLDELN
ncbi:5'-deoxynucleotidase [Beduinella massiliensis]|uniref:5'-deoxynucleotidase n=1 Tax=Beduinella massiliensis TaxID=1852363 RepID=UPI000C85983D